MSLASWLSWTFSRSQIQRAKRRPGASRPRTTLLFVEQLEERALLTSYTANTVLDLITDINMANGSPGPNTIQLMAATTTPYVLTTVANSTDGATGLPVIAANDNLTIVGNGDTIERSTASGTPAFRLFNVANGASLTLNNLTLQGGLAYGVGVQAEGGAIYSQGNLVLSTVTVEGNTAEGVNGTPLTPNYYYYGARAGGNGFGGAVYVAGGTATLTNVTLSANTASGGKGGSGNTEAGYDGEVGAAGGSGYGGALDIASGTVSLTGVTLSGNTAQGGQGGFSGSYADTEGYGYYGGGYDGGSYYGYYFNVGQEPNLWRGGNAYGGAVQVSGGEVILTSVTLSANSAQGGAGGTGIYGTYDYGYGGDGGYSYGGALDRSGGIVVIQGTATNATVVSANTAQGGAKGTGIATTLNYAGTGHGGGLYLTSNPTVYLDSATVANTSDNTDSSGLNGTTANIDGTYTVPSIYLQLPTVVNAASANPSPVTGTTTSLSVLGSDPDDASEAGLTYTWTVTSLPDYTYYPTFTFASWVSNGTNGAKNTTITFSHAGTYTFAVTLTDSYKLTTHSSVTVTVNQTETSIGVSPASASMDWGTTQQFTASAQDQFGLAMANQPAFTWTVDAGGAGGSVSTSGLYTAPFKNGSDTVRASDANFSGTAGVTVVLTPPTVEYPASAYSPVTGTTTNLSVLGYDPGDSSLTYTWAVTAAPAGALSGALSPTFWANGSNAAQNTTATFYRAGNYTFQVTITDPANRSAVSRVNVTVNQIPTSISVSPANVTLAVHSQQQFQAAALDQFGQQMAAQTFTWSLASGSIGSINNKGQYNAPNSGTGLATIQATAGGITGTATVTIQALPPVITQPASANPNSVTGTQTKLQVQASDPQGSNLSYAWSVASQPTGAKTPKFDNATNNNTNVTFYQAGSYTFTVTVTDAFGLVSTSSVTVTVVQTLSNLSLTPANVTLADGATQQFTATALDQFGMALASQPTFTWQVNGDATVSNTGLFTAPASGTGNFQVKVSADGKNAQADITVDL